MKNAREELLELIFGAGGLLSCSLKDFEERPQQREMTQQIMEAYRDKQIALIEAGTGTGKSLAYLIPAIFWAIKHQEKTVISTNTIALQEQLINKDIPFVIKMLDADIKAVLVKGMGNYFCLRKFRSLQEEMPLFEENPKDLERLESWLVGAKEGSKSEISFPLTPGTWEKVSAEADSCNHVKCPHYKQCFFFKARKEAADAQILVVNHYLLFADLIAKMDNEDKAMLPRYQRLILDEAHHLEDIALECLSRRIDFLGLLHLLSRVSSESNPKAGRLALIHETIASLFPMPSERVKNALFLPIEIDLPARKRAIAKQAELAFHAIQKFCSGTKEQKVPLKPAVLQHPVWLSEVRPLLLELSGSLKNYAQSLLSLRETLDELCKFQEAKVQNHVVDLLALATRLEEKGEILESICSEEEKEGHIRWIELHNLQKGWNISLVSAVLDVSAYLRDSLFHPLSTVTLCSATMSANQNFEFVKQGLGLDSLVERIIAEKIYDSPFDYQKRTLLLVPSDISYPTDPDFHSQSCEMIIKAIEASGGNAFVLFTSYEMLRQAYERVYSHFRESKLTFLKQGDASRNLLLDSFKNKDGSVLFATDSFWEGVDVPGDALRLVIIVKLPFKVPSDPLVQAKADLIALRGKDPFFEYAVPQAAMKFKQGFGRLMRKKNDRGCVLCLDKRLISKSYGKIFLKSLPPTPIIALPGEKLIEQMKDFYQKTKIGA